MTSALVPIGVVAEKLGVTTACIRQWAVSGRIVGAYKLNGVWRFDWAKVDRWYKAQEREPTVWGSIKGAASGGSGSSGRARKSDGHLERLLGIKP